MDRMKKLTINITATNTTPAHNQASSHDIGVTGVDGCDVADPTR